ncbi:Sorbitol dehydrogenase [Gryllus bimaculatus]|nr:Sorbitol dehydrogenase [Gryllus bimaculatus]
MEVLEFDSKKKELCLLEVPVPPKLSDHDVLVKVAYAGICGSDLKMLSGDIPVADKIILGHEICGTVAETGKEVDSIIPGDRVAIDPNSGCGVCPECADGNYHYCECGGGNNYVGVFRNGGWAEYCVVPARQAFLIPKNMAFELAALTEPLSCISHGWDKIQPLQIGKRILILGAGIAGNLYACLFHLNGHRKVTVCEPQEGRRKLFDNIGNMREQFIFNLYYTGFEIITPNQLKERKAKCPNWKVDVVVDCSGSVNALEDAVELLNNGGLLSIYGLAPPQAKFRQGVTFPVIRERTDYKFCSTKSILL